MARAAVSGQLQVVSHEVVAKSAYPTGSVVRATLGASSEAAVAAPPQRSDA